MTGKIQDILPHLVAAVVEDYGRLRTNADGALAIGQRAFEIATDRTTADLAAAAGLCCGAGALLARGLNVRREKVTDEQIAALISRWLMTSRELDGQSATKVIEAVLSLGSDQSSDKVSVVLREACLGVP